MDPPLAQFTGVSKSFGDVNAAQQMLQRIHHSIGGTFVFVTSDQGDAMGWRTGSP